MKLFIFVFISVLLITCKEKKEFIFDSLENKIEVININPSYEDDISIDNYYFLRSPQIKIPEEETYIGETQIHLQYKDKVIFLHKRQCDITILDTSYKIINSFNVKGKGLGYCRGIYSAVATDSSIIIYDSNLWKFLEFDYSGKFIKDKLHTKSGMPISITQMKIIDDKILATGVCGEGWENFINNKAYPNIFLFNYKEDELNWKVNYTPISFDELTKSSMHFHPDINALNFAVNNNTYYVFDGVSGEIAEFRYNNNQITLNKRYVMPKDVFTRHQELLNKDYQDYSTDNYKKWYNRGNFLLDIHFDQEYMICYLSEKDLRENVFKKKIVFVNLENNIVERVLHTPHNRFLRYAKNGELGFLGYANEEEDLDEITLYKIDYTKLF